VAALITAIALLAGSATALGQTTGPTGDQYDPAPERVEEAVGEAAVADEPAPPPAEPDRVVAGLPFTGLDLALLAFAAVLLGASGLALRRFTRTSGDRS
jgi:hypothetical protein